MERSMIVVDAEGARLVDAEPNLETYQRLVGGYIEHWPYGPARPTVYVNKEGFVHSLPVYASLDGETVNGPIVAVVESRDLTDADLTRFKRRLRMRT